MKSLTSALALVICSSAFADTVFLKNGVSVDGKVKQRDGYIEVDAGGNTVFYRESEIARIEENEKTGKQDISELAALWEQEEAELIKMTGLNAEQRRRVRGLIGDLVRSAADRLEAREKLVAMQAEVDVFRYLRFLMPDATYYQVPPLIEAMYYLDSNRAIREIIRGTQHNYNGARAKSLEILGALQHKDSIPLMARGLADEFLDVQIQAAYALARTGAKQATPALIELLDDPDLKLVNASRESLALLWREQVGDRVPNTAAEWKEIWDAQSDNVSGRIQLALQQPLVLPEEEFENE